MRRGQCGTGVTLIGEHAISAACFVATLSGMLDLHFILIAGMIFAVSSIVFLLAGLLTAWPPADVAKYTWRCDMTQATTTGARWQDYRLPAAALLALTTWPLAACW
jgi:SSS family solute:Na+ symporter